MVMVRRTLTADGRLVRWSEGREELIEPQVDLERVERTSEAEIAAPMAADDETARQDAAAYARRARRRTGLSQVAFALRIGVPLDTVRNWEQDKRAPAGPARALLRVLDRAPEAVLAVLE